MSRHNVPQYADVDLVVLLDKDPNQLIHITESLRKDLATCLRENEALKQSKGGMDSGHEQRSLAASESIVDEKVWIPAERDFPGSRREAVVFDTNTKAVQVQGIEELKDSNVIFGRLPSRWPGNVFIWIQKLTDDSLVPLTRYRITNNSREPEDFKYHSTIKMKGLAVSKRLGILTGKIQWIFIVRPSVPEGATWSSSESGGKQAVTI